MAGTESSTSRGACPTAAALRHGRKSGLHHRTESCRLHVGRLGDVDYRRLIGGTQVLKIAS